MVPQLENRQNSQIFDRANQLNGVLNRVGFGRKFEQQFELKFWFSVWKLSALRMLTRNHQEKGFELTISATQGWIFRKDVHQRSKPSNSLLQLKAGRFVSKDNTSAASYCTCSIEDLLNFCIVVSADMLDLRNTRRDTSDLARPRQILCLTLLKFFVQPFS